MKDLVGKLWYSEPVVFVGGLASSWAAIVAFDEASDAFSIPLWCYIVAVPVLAFLTPVVRGNVTPINDGK